jgi:uncharacterized membrane protein
VVSISTIAFLTVRALHVLLAATWLGTTAFVYIFLSPALDEVGPSSGKLMDSLARRGVQAFMSSVGGLAVVTGIWLYWRFTGGFDPATSGTMAARVFGAGGAAGILSLIIAGAVVTRTARKVTSLASKALAAPEGPERAALAAQVAALKRRASVAGKIVLALQVIALVCMAVGHYV